MAFPSSPTNGQTATQNGITYTYASATNSWTRTLGSIANLTISGNLTTGNISLTGNIIPNVANTYSLGNSTYYFKDAFIGPGSLYIDGQKVMQSVANTIVVSADINQTLKMSTSGSGDIQLDPTGTGLIAIKGPLQIEAASNITSSDGSAIRFTNPIATDTLSGLSANTDLTLSALGTGHIKVDDDLIVTGNFTVQGSSGNLSVTSLLVKDNIIDISAETTGTPTSNAGIRVVRGDQAATQLRWYEAGTVWQFTNDGSTYQTIVGKDTNGNISVGNIIGTLTTGAQPNITSTGTLTSLTVSGDATVAGNLTVSGSYEYANVTSFNVKDPIIEQGGNPNGTPLSSNDGKDRGQILHYYSSAAIDAFMGWDNSNSEFAFGSNVSTSSEVVTFNSFGNVRAGYYLGNGSQLTSVAATTAGTVTTGAQPNITSVGTLTSLTSSGLITATAGGVKVGNLQDPSGTNTVQLSSGSITVTGNITAGGGGSGNVTATYFIGNGSQLTGIISSYSNTNVASYLPTYTGNITAGNVNIETAIVASTLTSNVATGTAPLTVTSTTRVNNLNVSYANVSDYDSVATATTGTYYPTFVNGSTTANYQNYSNSALSFNAATGNLISTLLTGTLTTAAQPNITSTGTLASLSVTANVSAGNILTNNLLYANGTAWSFGGSSYSNSNVQSYLPTYSGIIGGTLSTAAQPNITSTGTLASTTLAANANITMSGTLSQVSGANLLSGTYITGTLTTAAQPNVTSVGTITSLSLVSASSTRASPTISASALTIDLNTGTVFSVSLNSNITSLTISNVQTSGKSSSFILIFTADGTARSVTWPASFLWPSGTAPTLTSTNGKKDVFLFFTVDGGTSWQAFISGQNF